MHVYAQCVHVNLLCSTDVYKRQGKSCVINEMVRRINSYFGCDVTLLMAPTGVAAKNIAGQTIHSALRINASQRRGGR